MEKRNKFLRNIAELIEKGLFSSKDLKKEMESAIKFNPAAMPDGAFSFLHRRGLLAYKNQMPDGAFSLLHRSGLLDYQSPMPDEAFSFLHRRGACLPACTYRRRSITRAALMGHFHFCTREPAKL